MTEPEIDEVPLHFECFNQQSLDNGFSSHSYSLFSDLINSGHPLPSAPLLEAERERAGSAKLMLDDYARSSRPEKENERPGQELDSVKPLLLPQD